jgi:hypothetical protein
MTTPTRRSLLRATALAAALTPLLVAPEAYAAATTRRDLYSRTRFTSLRRKTFRLEGDGRHWRVRLVEVGNLPSSYVLRRPGFRATTLFLVPDAHRRSYQAVVFRKP